MRTVWAGEDKPDLNNALAGWLTQHLDGVRPSPPFTTMGVFSRETLIAVMLYNNFHKKSGVIEIHGAATDKRWLTRPVLWEMFSYPFEQLRCQLVVMRCGENNMQWNGRGLPRFLKAYGFEAYRIPRLRSHEEAEIIYTLTDDAWAGNGFHKDR